MAATATSTPESGTKDKNYDLITVTHLPRARLAARSVRPGRRGGRRPGARHALPQDAGTQPQGRRGVQEAARPAAERRLRELTDRRRLVGGRKDLAAREHESVGAARLDEAVLELLVVELGIPSALRDELRMSALLDDAAAVEEEDDVRGEDRREPVRNRDRRAP